MQTKSDRLYSPSDLVAFLECHHSTLLSRMSNAIGIEEAKEDDALLLLRKKGLEHEQDYLNSLKDDGKRVIEIPKNIHRQERVERSRQAMREGADIIYQAAFYAFPWLGDADFLIKIDTPSSLGNYSYEVLDTKLAHNPGPDHIIQLCAYSDFLSQSQGVLPESMHLFLGSKQKHPFKVADFYAYYLHARKRFEAFLAKHATITSSADVTCPTPCAYCDFCAWHDACAERWEQEDHLCLVANIQGGQIKKLQQSGIGTLEKLATSPPDMRVPDMQPDTFARLRSQAALQLRKRISGENRVELLPQVADRGFARLPMPDAGDLFFDMEGDPYHPNGLEYLFGVYCSFGDAYDFRAFWGHSHAEEKEAFRAFMAFVAERLSHYPNAHIYHYNHYEPTALKRLACRYAVCEEQLDNLLRQNKFVDLYKVVRESMRTSESGYSIKDMEIFYLPPRENAVTSAGDSVVMYNRWRELGDPQLLQDIAEYNKVDCISTFELLNWLLKQRPSGMAWFGESEIEENADFAERKPWEIESEDYRNRLSALSDGEASDSHFAHDEYSLLSDLLEFHRREAKPQWWNSFARREKTEEELLDDVDCIAGLQLLGGPESVQRSLVYTYRFPSQEYRIKEKDTVFNVADMKAAGTVISLDDRACELQIKRGVKNGELPEYMHVGPPSPIDANILRDALYRFADDIISEPQKKNVGREILQRSRPRIAGKLSEAPIITGENVLAEAIEAVAGLQESYLFIQGPPGTGKTYTSSHIIVDLIARGYKVGVSSNSHKAIHNLLHQVEQAAQEKGITFTGVKKSSGEETAFDGTHIHSVSNKKKMPLDSDLYAGTAWLFSDPMFDGLLDYLFIDEAGQVALANVIAMSGSARNIILVGDQMQLGQPIQGTHPGQKGIFLPETRRMAPKVCSFISETFYDGRLTAHPDTAKRRLVFPKTTDIDVAGGIAFMEAEHRQRSQRSPEEGEIVQQLYQQLLTASLHDDKNGVHKLSPQDILIVSPYNMQVNLLQSLLPEARVGTVDKFQGQEAPVVIFSMATSSAEDLPRNIEFLFSENRLNVAISRAQCLAIVVASPLLAEVPCRTVEQMRLVNTFCRLYGEAKIVGVN